MQPMSQNEIVALLTQMKLETKSRAEDGGDVQGQFVAYARRIAEYPADVVREVLGTQSGRGIFWPAWAELKERLDAKSSYRRKLLHAIENPPAPVPPTAPKAERAVTPEAQAILDAYARKRESDATPIAEPTPEEMERRRLEFLAMCQA
jgi:hypothetical protein